MYVLFYNEHVFVCFILIWCAMGFWTFYTREGLLVFYMCN